MSDLHSVVLIPHQMNTQVVSLQAVPQIPIQKARLEEAKQKIKNDISILVNINAFKQENSQRSQLNKWFQDSVKNYFLEVFAAPLIKKELGCNSIIEVKRYIHSNISKKEAKFMILIQNYYTELIKYNKLDQFRSKLENLVLGSLYDQSFQEDENKFGYSKQKIIRKQFVGLLLLVFCDCKDSSIEVTSFYDLWNRAFPNDIKHKKKLSRYDTQRNKNNNRIQNMKESDFQGLDHQQDDKISIEDQLFENKETQNFNQQVQKNVNGDSNTHFKMNTILNQDSQSSYECDSFQTKVLIKIPSSLQSNMRDTSSNEESNMKNGNQDNSQIKEKSNSASTISMNSQSFSKIQSNYRMINQDDSRKQIKIEKLHKREQSFDQSIKIENEIQISSLPRKCVKREEKSSFDIHNLKKEEEKGQEQIQNSFAKSSTSEKRCGYRFVSNDHAKSSNSLPNSPLQNQLEQEVHSNQSNLQPKCLSSNYCSNKHSPKIQIPLLSCSCNRISKIPQTHNCSAYQNNNNNNQQEDDITLSPSNSAQYAQQKKICRVSINFHGNSHHRSKSHKKRIFLQSVSHQHFINQPQQFPKAVFHGIYYLVPAKHSCHHNEICQHNSSSQIEGKYENLQSRIQQV